MKLIAKNPDDRYQSAAEMLRDLAQIRGAEHDVDHRERARSRNRRRDGRRIGVERDGDQWHRPRHRPRQCGGHDRPGAARVRSRACAAALANLQLGHRGLTALVVFGLLAGLVRGWFTRPEDLLSDRAEASSSSSSLPALWMAPHWADDRTAIEPRGAVSLRPAPRLACRPGSRLDRRSRLFPGLPRWISQAYIQLARVLFRRHDAERLRVFATEIGRWNATQEHEKELVTIIQAAANAIDGDQEGTIVELEKLHLSSTIDPALLELALEVTVQATHSASRTGIMQSIPQGLQDLQRNLLTKLSTVEIREHQRRR